MRFDWPRPGVSKHEQHSLPARTITQDGVESMYGSKNFGLNDGVFGTKYRLYEYQASQDSTRIVIFSLALDVWCNRLTRLLLLGLVNAINSGIFAV